MKRRRILLFTILCAWFCTAGTPAFHGEEWTLNDGATVFPEQSVPESRAAEPVAVLQEAGEDLEAVDVPLQYADGTEITSNIFLPRNAALWYVFRDASGRMTAAGEAAVRKADGVLNLPETAPAIPEDADTVAFFPLHSGLTPAAPGVQVSLRALSEDYETLYREGKELLAAGDWQGAVNVFTAAISRDGTQPLALTGRGDAYVCLGETAELLSAAMADYEAALELDRDCAEAYLGVADVYIRQADYERAEAVLQEAVTIVSEPGRIQPKLAQLQEGNVTDSQGKNRRMSSYEGDSGILRYRFDFTYDSTGRLASVTGFDEVGRLTGQVELQYDASGRITRDYSYNVDRGTLLYKDYSYDDSGNLIQSDSHYTDGTMLNSFHMEYNENNSLAREEYYNSEEKLQYYYLYRYEIDPLLWSRRDKYTQKDIMAGYQTRTYREDGQWLVFCNYVVEETLNSSVKINLQWRWVYEYDDSGKRTKWTQFDGNGNVTSETRYDETGNATPLYITDIQNDLKMDYAYDDVVNEQGVLERRRVDTCSGTASLTFNEYLYSLEGYESIAELRLLDRAPALVAGIARDTALFKSVESMLEDRSSTNLRIYSDPGTNVVNRAIKVLTIRFDHARDGEFLTFSGSLCNQYGNVFSQPLTVSVEFRQVRVLTGQDENGDPVYSMTLTPIVHVNSEDDSADSGSTGGGAA